MARPAGLRALALFHLHVGARLAMRAAAPLAGLPFVIVLVQEDPAGAMRAGAAWLLGPGAAAGGGLAVAAVALALSSWAAPRVTAGLGGWARHLPVSQATHRRAALVALATAQAPLLVGLALLAPLAARQPGGLATLRLVALVPTVGAAAVAAWPGEHAWRHRPMALVALLLAARSTLPSVLAALALAAAAELLAGPLASAGPPRRRPHPPVVPTALLVALRALGPAALASALASLLPVAAMALLRANNDLSPAVAAGAARLGGGLACATLLAWLAERLAERRPVWPWARSLPVSAMRRVGEDAALLAAAALVPVAATGCLDARAALAVGACVPLVAARAAGAVRGGTARRTGAGTAVLGEAALLAAWVAVVPWLGLAALALSPLAWRAAAEADRRQKVSRWDELHHRAVGDPLSWSAR